MKRVIVAGVGGLLTSLLVALCCAIWAAEGGQSSGVQATEPSWSINVPGTWPAAPATIEVVSEAGSTRTVMSWKASTPTTGVYLCATYERAYGLPFRCLAYDELIEASIRAGPSRRFASDLGPWRAVGIEAASGDRRIPGRVVWLRLLGNTAVLGLLIWLLLTIATIVRGRIRRLTGRCVRCGYRAGIADSTRCPECGSPVCR